MPSPKELAAQLGVEARQVRRVLRKAKGTLKIQGRSRRWELSEEEVKLITEAFQPKPA